MSRIILEAGDPNLPSLAYTGDHKAWLARVHEYIYLRGFRVYRHEIQLRPLVNLVLAAYPKEAASYRGGKTKLLGFFVAKILEATRNGADPDLITRLLKAAVDSG